jgi:hypothetical protein
MMAEHREGRAMTGDNIFIFGVKCLLVEEAL